MTRVLSLYFQSLPSAFREKSGLTRLLRWAYQFSPIVALDQAPSRTYKENPLFCGINLDISGSERLFKGEGTLLARIRQDASTFGITARACIAPTLGAAWAFSRYGAHDAKVLHTAELKGQLAGLPLSALRIEQRVIKELNELNIRRIAHLLSVPPRALNTRFPQEVVLRLHQAIGTLEEPLKAVSFKESYVVTRNLSADGGGSVSAPEIIAAHCKELLQQLLETCRAEQQLIAQLLLRFDFAEAPSLTQSCSLSVPTDDFDHLWSLLSQRIEQSPIEFGVQELRLYCPSQELARAYGGSFLDHNETHSSRSREYAKLLDSLYQELGERHVLALRIQESHIPERSFAFVPKVHRPQGISLSRQPQLVHLERPSVLYPRPQAIRAMAVLPDTPPFWILWNGSRQNIHSSIGPERIAPEWWGEDPTLCKTRDYFRVQLQDGLWLWIYRELENNSWFLHGMWA